MNQIKKIFLPLIFFLSFWFVASYKPSVLLLLAAIALNFIFLYFTGKFTGPYRARLVLFFVLQGIAGFCIPSAQLALAWYTGSGVLYGILLKDSEKPSSSLEHTWLKLLMFSLSFILYSFKYYFDLSLFGPVFVYIILFLILLGAFAHLHADTKSKFAASSVLALITSELFFAIHFLPTIPVVSALVLTGVAISLFQLVHFYLLHELSLKRLKYQLIINSIFIIAGSLAGKWTL